MTQLRPLPLLILLAVSGLQASCFGVGEYSSIAIGRDGLGLVSYVDTLSDVLKVAHCDDVACTSASASTLGRADEASTSLAIGKDGRGLIAYRDTSLAVAHCEDAACTAATVAHLPVSAFHASLAVGRDGRGLIAFQTGRGAVGVAHCEDARCTEATITTIDPGGTSLGSGPALALGSDGLGLLAYQSVDRSRGQLKVAHCEDVACTTATVRVADAGAVPAGLDPAVAIGPDGLAWIAHRRTGAGADLVLARCLDVACSQTGAAIVVEPQVSQGEAALAIGADGLALLSTRGTGALGTHWRVTHCNDAGCRGTTVTIVDSSREAGRSPSLVIGSDGLGLTSAYDGDLTGLKVAHCENVPCTRATVTVLDQRPPQR